MVKKRNDKSTSYSKVISAIALMLCLVFLTSLNYFIYPDAQERATHAQQHGSADDGTAGTNPAGPTEEKASSGITLLEEFLHESHPLFDFAGLDQQYLHRAGETELIELFHGELLSPPPEC